MRGKKRGSLPGSRRCFSSAACGHGLAWRPAPDSRVTLPPWWLHPVSPTDLSCHPCTCLHPHQQRPSYRWVYLFIFFEESCLIKLRTSFSGIRGTTLCMLFCRTVNCLYSGQASPWLGEHPRVTKECLWWLNFLYFRNILLCSERRRMKSILPWNNKTRCFGV